MHKTIQTASGIVISLEDPSANIYSIHDIGYALSQLCRFNGHCTPFYSVAQHCVSVSNIVSPEHALEALLHDAAEAYIGDVTSPLKAMLKDFKEIERKVERSIRISFGLPVELHSEVKAADLRLLATEQRDLMPKLKEPWGITAGVPTLAYHIEPLNSGAAYHLFMDRYLELTR